MFEKMNMNGLSEKMMNRFFRRVDHVVWDLFSGKIGVQTPDGITTIEGTGDDAQIVVNIMEQFGMPVPAYAQSTPINSVAVGDLIYANNKPKGWITEVIYKEKPLNDAEETTIEARQREVKRFRLMTPSGTSSTWTPPKVSMLGFDSGVMVLRSLMNMLPGGETGLNSMQGMLMPMMMLGDGDMDLESIMPMMLFSQLGVSGTGADASGNGMGNMMQTMMMMQMMGGVKKKGRSKPPMSGGGFFDGDD